MKIKYPNYDNCITCVPNSILKYFGINEERQSSALLDSFLKEKEYDNVVVLLLDGMGKCIMDGNLESSGFFCRNLKEVYSSVFPPTTVAATTSMLSGMNPCEHGWLGWDCYYPQIDKNVTVFLNTETETGLPAAEYNVAFKYNGYENVIQKINRVSGVGSAYAVTPFFEPFPQTFEEISGIIADLCRKPGKKYIYSYWREPDHIMHEKGCYGEDAKTVLKDLEEQVEVLCNSLENTLFVITADHGHMDSKGVALSDYPKLLECLVRMPSIEPRALNLFVKTEKHEQFLAEFNKEFGEKFLLISKEEVIEKQLFGPDAEHPAFRGMLGDYLAVATDDLTIFSTREQADFFIGVHAGLTEDEIDIPLIVIER